MGSSILKDFASLEHSTLRVKGRATTKPSVSPATLDAARRWDPDLPLDIAKDFVDGHVITEVLGRQRGGPVDIYFVVSDREKGYRAAVPAIRRILDQSSLALDFHYMEPGEVDRGG